MGGIVKLYPNGAAKNPDNVLEQAIGVYDTVLVIGYNKEEGNPLEVRASTNQDHKEILWMVEQFKHRLIHGVYMDD